MLLKILYKESNMNLFKQSSVILFSIASILFSCKNPSGEKNKPEQIPSDTGSAMIYPSEAGSDTSKTNESVNVSVKTIQQNSQWGYDILVDGKLYIHQPSIPSVPGNEGFKTEEDAKKTGEFIEYKIQHHIMPPSVTPEELDSLGVWKKQK
jgi:Domain of unknown function (DUF4907)